MNTVPRWNIKEKLLVNKRVHFITLQENPGMTINVYHWNVTWFKMTNTGVFCVENNNTDITGHNPNRLVIAIWLYNHFLFETPKLRAMAFYTLKYKLITYKLWFKKTKMTNMMTYCESCPRCIKSKNCIMHN